jgi:hypothetical protein
MDISVNQRQSAVQKVFCGLAEHGGFTDTKPRMSFTSMPAPLQHSHAFYAV